MSTVQDGARSANETDYFNEAESAGVPRDAEAREVDDHLPGAEASFEEQPQQKKRRLTEIVAEEFGNPDADYDGAAEGDAPFADTLPAGDIDSRIQQVVKKKTVSRKKRQDGEDLDAFHDELIMKLRNSMMHAADLDTEANEAGEPALNKTRMLPHVVEVLQKASLGEALIENGILEAIRRWLEPLPDRSLPSMNIQRALIESLRRLPIETSSLKASRVARVILFYTKCKRVDPQISRVCQHLVYEWIRPILRRSKSYADRPIHVASAYESASRGSVSSILRRPDNSVQAPAPYRKGDPSSSALPVRPTGRIPEPVTASFTIAPSADPHDRGRASTGPDVASHAAAAHAAGVKYREYKKKLLANENATRRI